MSDAPRNDTWWQASDGKWYPPSDQAPHPGWWLASDGNWYPPEPEAERRGARPGSAVTGGPSSTPPKPSKPSKPSGRAGRGRERARPQPLHESASPTASASPAKAPAAGTPSAPAPKSGPAEGGRPLPGPRPNTNDGVSPQDQIARRNSASQADRQVLARSRSLAASRLLASVAKEQGADAGSRPVVPTAKAAKPDPPLSTTAKSKAGPRSTSTDRPTSPNDPLLEVKQSALAADVEHLGERLAIFNDRVELRDRHDAVRQVVMGDDIADIVVNKRLTGAVLTIETVEGPVMVAKGLRPEQAEEARQLIMRKTRPTGPVQRTDRPPAAKSPRSGPGPVTPSHVDVVVPGTSPRPTISSRPIDEADVLRKLGDLHRLGILTTQEYEDKIALVGSLVRGEITLPA